MSANPGPGTMLLNMGMLAGATGLGLYMFSDEKLSSDSDYAIGASVGAVYGGIGYPLMEPGASPWYAGAVGVAVGVGLVYIVRNFS